MEKFVIVYNEHQLKKAAYMGHEANERVSRMMGWRDIWGEWRNEEWEKWRGEADGGKVLLYPWNSEVVGKAVAIVWKQIKRKTWFLVF